MKHHLTDLVKVARALEVLLSEKQMHVAIGGGCLLRGESEKDMDLFVYPHEGPECDKHDVIDAVESLGWQRDEGKSEYGAIDVQVFNKGEQRLDVFILERRAE